MTAAASLLDLDADQLTRESRSREAPKWSTLCLLRRVGLPVLDAVRVPPGTTDADADRVVDQALDRFGGDRVLVRSDGGVERGAYYVGGSSLARDAAQADVRRLTRQGRTVILMAPTDRLRNLLAVGMRIDRPDGDGALRATIEVLGPGFDVADLNRGGIAPVVRIDAQTDSLGGDGAWPADVTVDLVDDADGLEERRRERLTRVGARILPALGVVDAPVDADAAVDWLRSAGIDHLWRSVDLDLVAGWVPSWLADLAGVAALWPRPTWTCLCLTFSDLGDGRSVYWDIVDAERKYGGAS